MKTIAFFFIALFLGVAVLAQSPESFRYQAVARDNSGNILANEVVSFQISILSGSVAGTVEYIETHLGLATNSFGLVELEIGKGTAVTGAFSAISWGNNSYFIKIEMDPAGGSVWQELSTSQLLSVPYSMHAKTVETGDNWGSETVSVNATLSGNGTAGNPLMVADNGITSAKIANGTIISSDLADMSVNSAKIQDGSIITSDLADNAINGYKIKDGSISSVDLDNDIITTSKILNGTIIANDLSNNSITTDKLVDEVVTGNKIAQQKATSGQVLKWNGSTWAPANDVVGEGLTLPYNGTATTGAAAFNVSNLGAGIGILGEGPTAIRGESSAADGYGVYGKNFSTTGTNYGIYGISSSTTGRGVFGGTTATTGANCGVKGETSSVSGMGVMGVALASSGTSYGVRGVTYSSSGYGVYGEALTSGTNYGVYGSSLSSTGFGVYGEVTSSSGTCSGVYGVSSSTTGRGVYGLANSSSGQNFGVRGTSTSTEGIAIYGYASATSGQPFGIIGHTVAPYGTAIFGHCDASSGTAIAVRGESYSSSGYGIHGTARSTSGKNYGGYFETLSSTGYGIWGAGPKYGIYGVSTGSSAARAIIGEAQGTGSIGVMGLGLEANSTGVWGEGALYDFYANGPGTNYGSASSIRWKTNVTNISEPIEKINAIRGVYFDWDENHGGQHDIGFIAEEVGKVLPEIVVYEENGIDASGMDYSKITPLLVEAVKVLKAENDLLKQRLDKLETEMGFKAEK